MNVLVFYTYLNPQFSFLPSVHKLTLTICNTHCLPTQKQQQQQQQHRFHERTWTLRHTLHVLFCYLLKLLQADRQAITATVTDTELLPAKTLTVPTEGFFDVEDIYGFVRWGGLQAKSMTSQRAAFKMPDMRYYGKVMTTTRWLLYSTSSTVQS